MTSINRLPTKIVAAIRQSVIVLARLTAAVAAILIVAAAISLPLWYLARYRRSAFNILLLALAVALLIRMVFRRIRGSRTE